MTAKVSWLPRGELTTYLLAQLAGELTVGDAEAPEAGGWDDDPNDPNSSYVPYVVLMPLTVNEGSGSLGDSNTEFKAPYSLNVYAVSREQVEYYADQARKVLSGLVRSVIQLGDTNWKIQQARASSIGGVSRSDATEPSEFTQNDVVTMYLSKEF